MSDEAVAARALARGLATPAQLEQARARLQLLRQAGLQGDLLGVLAPQLGPAAVAELRAATSAPPPAGGASATLAPARPDAMPAPARPGASDLPRAGDRLGPYVVTRELGRGGMGVVYAAEHGQLRRPVALKLELVPPGADPRRRLRVLLEGQAAARLRHEGIVGVHDLGRDEQGRVWIAMDLVDGEGLDARVAREGPLPPREVARLGLAVARALEHAHAQGVLHRDLKPANVLLRRDGAPLVTDFGLAKVHAAEALTRTGEVLGTPAYMPPEQADGRTDLDARADVYSLGATLYHLLLGRPPFHGDNVLATLALVLRGRLEPPRAARADVPADLEAVVLRCLAHDREARYPSAGAVADDLARLLAGEEPVAAARARADRRRRLLLVGLGLVVVAGGLGAAFALALRPAPPPPAPPPARAEPAAPTSDLAPAQVAPRPLDPVAPPPRRVEDEYLAPGLWVPPRAAEALHPPGRCSHAMAWDPRRGRVVVVGGHDDSQVFDDLWSWDGLAWRDEAPAGRPGRPPARFVHALVYDEARRRLVLLGGVADLQGRHAGPEVWEEELEGRWRPITPPDPGPLPRGWAGAAYDPVGERTLLFGGTDPEGRQKGDLWAWDGAAWSPLGGGPGPGPRSEAMLAWDVERGALLVAGGSDAGSMAELWEWHPARGWARRALPEPRGHPGLVGIPGGALLFGGNPPGGRGTDGTWTWDGAAWTPRRCGFPGTLPPIRTWHALAWDPVRRVVTAFAGHTGRRYLDDTWELRPVW